MAQVTRRDGADQTSSDDDADTTVTNVGDSHDLVAGPSQAELSPSPSRGGGSGGGKAGARVASGGGEGAGFFTIRKKGQGYWTRMGTALGAGLIIALTAHFVYSYLPPWLEPLFAPPTETATALQRQAAAAKAHNVALGVCAAILIGFGLLAWRLMNRAGNVDFLIATDSEMKKVNWTSRRELIGSTKVVIIFMFLIAGILFFIDIIFGFFFQWINVLDAGPFG